MDNSNFKSSEEVKLTDDTLFMAQFSNRLQLEPFPVYTKKKFNFVSSLIVVCMIASIFMWFLWPIAHESAVILLDQIESSLGLSIGILLSFVGLLAVLIIETESGQWGEELFRKL
jgi:hypothetical protein